VVDEEGAASDRHGQEGFVIAGLLPVGRLSAAETAAPRTESGDSDGTTGGQAVAGRIRGTDALRRGLRVTHSVARSVAAATGVHAGGEMAAVNWSRRALRLRDGVSSRARPDPATAEGHRYPDHEFLAPHRATDREVEAAGRHTSHLVGASASAAADPDQPSHTRRQGRATRHRIHSITDEPTLHEHAAATHRRAQTPPQHRLRGTTEGSPGRAAGPPGGAAGSPGRAAGSPGRAAGSPGQAVGSPREASSPHGPGWLGRLTSARVSPYPAPPIPHGGGASLPEEEQRVPNATDSPRLNLRMRGSAGAAADPQTSEPVSRREHGQGGAAQGGTTSFNPASPAGLRLRRSLGHDASPRPAILPLRHERHGAEERAASRPRWVARAADSPGSEAREIWDIAASEGDALSTSSDDDGDSVEIPSMAPFQASPFLRRTLGTVGIQPRVVSRGGIMLSPLQPTDDELADILLSGAHPAGLPELSQRSPALRVPGVPLAVTQTDDPLQRDSTIAAPSSLIATNRLETLRRAIEREARGEEEEEEFAAAASQQSGAGLGEASAGASLISAPAAAILDSCLVPSSSSSSAVSLPARHVQLGRSIDPSPMQPASTPHEPPPLSLGPARLAEVRDAAARTSHRREPDLDRADTHRPAVTVPAVPLTPLLAPLNRRPSTSTITPRRRGASHALASSSRVGGPIRSRFGAKVFLSYADIITSLKASLSLRSRVSSLISSARVEDAMRLLQERVPFVFAAAVRAAEQAICSPKPPPQQPRAGVPSARTEQQASDAQLHPAAATRSGSVLALLVELHCARAAIAAGAGDRDSALRTLRNSASPLLTALVASSCGAAPARGAGLQGGGEALAHLRRLVRDTTLLVSGVPTAEQPLQVASSGALSRLSRRVNDLIVDHSLLMRVQRRMAERLLSISQSNGMRRVPSGRRRRSSIPHPVNVAMPMPPHAQLDSMPMARSAAVTFLAASASASGDGAVQAGERLSGAHSSSTALIERLVSLGKVLSGRPIHHQQQQQPAAASAIASPRHAHAAASASGSQPAGSARTGAHSARHSEAETGMPSASDHATHTHARLQPQSTHSDASTDRVAEASMLLQLMRRSVELAAPPPASALDTALQQLLLVQELLRVSAGSVGPRFVLPSAADSRALLRLRAKMA
jgi:hypothetical protein